MSTLALKKLEEQLKCAVCLEDYKDPKVLQCFHVFCQNCLGHRRMVVQNQEGGRSLLCPTCRQATPIPPSGVSGLQSAFHINHLLEIQESFKKGQDSPSSERKGASNITTQSKKVPLYCPEHANKKLKLYCQTCEKLICSKCVYRGGQHHSHEYEEISEAFERYKEEVTPSLESIEKQKKRINLALTELGTRRDEISNQRQTIEADIHNTIGRLHMILEVRKTELIGQLHAITQGKMKNLAAQEDHLETLQAQLSSCLLFLEESFKRGSEGEVLRMKKTVVKQVKELTAPFKADTLKPKTEANMATSFSADVIGMCQKFGEVHASELDPSQRHATSKGAETHQLSIKVEDEGIRAIPPAAIKSPEEKIIRTIGEVERPHGVALGKKGEVIVTEFSKHLVSIFSSDGKKLRSFGTYGSDKGQFKSPKGVAVDGEGNILVADSNNKRIQKFTSSGQFLKVTREVQFSSPDGIAFNSSNNKIYVSDRANHRVQVLNSDLTYSSTIGRQGSGNGEFYRPWSISCDSTGKVYVADCWNHRIQVFTAEETFMMKFGKRGVNEGNLKDPFGIAIDTSGLIYVSEIGKHRISVFTSEGQFISTFGRYGSGPGEFSCPHGLAVNKDGILYVCDWGNNRVQCFK